MITTTYRDIKSHLVNDLCIKSDDVIFLFSGIWGLGKIKDNNLAIIIDAFNDVLTSGVLIIPTFSYSWNNGKEWNIKEINCPEMGSLSEYTINYNNFLRSNHPNFSVNILKNSNNINLVNNFLDIDNNTFGKNSIFGKVYNYSKNKRAFVFLFGGAFDDVLYRSTFIHFAQQKIGVKHRFLKKIYDPHGNKFVFQYSRYFDEAEVLDKTILRQYNLPIEEDFKLYGEDLLKYNKLVVKKFKFYPSRIVNVYDSVNFMINEYKKNKYYCIKNKSIK